MSVEGFTTGRCDAQVITASFFRPDFFEYQIALDPPLTSWDLTLSVCAILELVILFPDSLLKSRQEDLADKAEGRIVHMGKAEKSTSLKAAARGRTHEMPFGWARRDAPSRLSAAWARLLRQLLARQLQS